MIQPTAQQLYPAQGSGANAVSINIFNPQAYGTPKNPAPNASMTYPNSIYAMPQASLYQPMQMPAAMQYPMYPGLVQQNIAPQQPMQYPTYPDLAQQPVAPQPQLMPDTVIPEAVNVQQQAVEPQAAQTTEPQAVQQPEVADTVETPQAPIINTDELVQNLSNADADIKADTINKIAEYIQSEPEVALQVVSEPIMNSLVNIINEDTTALEGPTKEQIDIAEKIAKGEQLTPEENALSEQLSPRDKANKNRIFALYTLAMIQKLQRDELNQYIETQKANGEQPLEPLALDNLIGYNEIVNVINNDPRPEVKVAAIQALQFITEPQDKALVENVLASSLNSQDEAVKQAANEVIASFNQAAA